MNTAKNIKWFFMYVKPFLNFQLTNNNSQFRVENYCLPCQLNQFKNSLVSGLKNITKIELKIKIFEYNILANNLWREQR